VPRGHARPQPASDAFARVRR